MKTAISIPDALFKKAEKLASELGLSRSKLFANAIATFIKAYEDAENVRKLNEVYGEVDSGLDEGFMEAQAEIFEPGDW